MKSPRPPPRFRNHSPQQTHQDKNPSLSIDANKTNLEQHLQQPHESPSNENRLDVLDQFKEENVQVDQKSTRITNGSSAIPRMTKRKGYIQNNRYAIYPTDAVKKSLTRRRKIPIDTDTAKK